MAARKKLDKDFVVGDNSLGDFFENAGYAALPSPKHTSPGTCTFVH